MATARIRCDANAAQLSPPAVLAALTTGLRLANDRLIHSPVGGDGDDKAPIVVPIYRALQNPGDCSRDRCHDLAEQAHPCQDERGWQCRSSLRCGGFIPATGHRSVAACGSSAPTEFASDVVGPMA